MIKTIKENPENNDLFFNGKDFEFIENIDATAQTAKSSIEVLKGEIESNITLGVPHLEILQEKNIDKFDFFVKKTILETQNVISIISYNSKIIDESITYSANIQTVFGNIEI